MARSVRVAPHPLMIKELPTDERPREKMKGQGAQAMGNSELIAILLRTGNPAESALRLAENLLERQGGLAGFGNATMEDIEQIKGIGEAKAITILAAVELGRRVTSLAPQERAVIRTPDDVASLLMPRFRYETKEAFLAVLLSTKNHVLKTPVISIGSLNASIVHPREVFREAINASAASVILAHNHPSGDPAPSPEDIGLTRKLVEAGRVLDIPVLDHVVLGDGKYISFKEKGIL
ncbi:MAG TPA: DNA repair protein RadC [Negativicutes bacterium]|nr:DNA repair protein RadC [Negativicutes bacterium]